MLKRTSLALLSVFIISVFTYWLTSAGNTPYNYFVRLADAFLHGRYWLTENPPWLSELVPAGLSRFYVIYPPMPALLLIPLVFLFGPQFPQQYLAQVMGAGIVALTMILSWKIKRDGLLSLWSGVFIGFGTIIWYLSATGSVWFLGQISAAFFLTAALVFGLKKNPFLTGLFLGAAYLSRIHTILSVPLFIYLLWPPPGHKNKFPILSLSKLIFGLAPFLLFNAIYNYVRFGALVDVGYMLIPGIFNEPWFKHGIESPYYIWGNLKIAFLSLPKFLNTFPYIEPSWAGLSILITTPGFIFALRANLKENLNRLLWLSVLLIFIFVLMHGSSGFAQFGYRFAVDFYPFLMLLVIKGVAKTGLRWYHWLFLIWGVIVNLWGVLWINKFGWVSF